MHTYTTLYVLLELVCGAYLLLWYVEMIKTHNTRTHTHIYMNEPMSM